MTSSRLTDQGDFPAEETRVDGIVIAGDGPLAPAGWIEKCRGRVVGVMVPE